MPLEKRAIRLNTEANINPPIKQPPIAYTTGMMIIDRIPKPPTIDGELVPRSLLIELVTNMDEINIISPITAPTITP